MLPSPYGCRLGLRGFALSRPLLRSFALRPSDSDKALRFRPRKVASPLGQSYQPQPFVQELVRELPRSLAALLLVFSSQPLTKHPSGVGIHRPIGFADPTQAEVIGPSPPTFGSDGPPLARVT